MLIKQGFEETNIMGKIKSSKPPVVLTIGGFDSSSGAGITRDLATINYMGCYGISVVTNITVQNSIKVYEVVPLEKEKILRQLEVLTEDFPIKGIKIGMLGNQGIVKVVSKWLKNQSCKNIVVDPVTFSSSGYPLLDKGGIKVMGDLMKQAMLVTPNRFEADCFFPEWDNQSRFERNDNGPEAILFKGGHSVGLPIDQLFLEKEGVYTLCHEFSGERYQEKSVHGTGCTLASLITSHCALGESLVDAIDKSKIILSKWILEAEKLGSGEDLILGGMW